MNEVSSNLVFTGILFLLIITFIFFSYFQSTKNSSILKSTVTITPSVTITLSPTPIHQIQETIPSFKKYCKTDADCGPMPDCAPDMPRCPIISCISGKCEVIY